MKAFNDLLIRVSQSGPMFFWSTVFFAGALVAVFFNINDVFQGTVGFELFDFQDDLTAAQIYEQLPFYDDAARKLYYAFSFVDFFFPFFGGVFLGAIAAFAMRHLSGNWYRFMDERNLFAIFFIPALFDWCENIFALAVISSYPNELTWAANLLVAAKFGKLTSIKIFNPISLLLLVLAALAWAGRKAGLIKSGS